MVRVQPVLRDQTLTPPQPLLVDLPRGRWQVADFLAQAKALTIDSHPLAALFAGSVGVFEGYSLEQHTRQVLRQFEHYIPDAALPEGCTRPFMRKLLLVHDLGKPSAVSVGDKEAQHAFTLALVQKLDIPLFADKNELKRALALIDGDPLGALLRDRMTPEQAAAEITAMAKRAAMPVPDFYRALLLFYQCDAASYTADAGGQPSLERLFGRGDDGALVYDARLQRLRFNDDNEARLRRLEPLLAATPKRALRHSKDTLESSAHPTPRVMARRRAPAKPQTVSSEPTMTPLQLRAGGIGAVAESHAGRSHALSRLNATQRAALDHVEAQAKRFSEAARPELVRQVQALGYSEADLDRCLAFIKNDVPVTINFDPDRKAELALAPYERGRTDLPAYKVAAPRDQGLIHAYLADTHFRNQFETGVSSAIFSGYAGGERDEWERTIFGGSYHRHALIPAERPKYGALNISLHPRGGATPYGKSHLVMKAGAHARITLTPTDSLVCDPSQVGTPAHCNHVLAALGTGRLERLLQAALQGTASDCPTVAYLEAQIHGPVEFAKDFDRLVAQAKYRGGPYEEPLRAFCQKNGIALHWVDGETVTPDRR